MSMNKLILFITLTIVSNNCFAFEKYFKGFIIYIGSEDLHRLTQEGRPHTLFSGDQIIKKICPSDKKECSIKPDEFYYFTELLDKSCLVEDEKCIISGYIVAELRKDVLLKKMSLDGYDNDTRGLASVGYIWGRIYNKEGSFIEITEPTKLAGNILGPVSFVELYAEKGAYKGRVYDPQKRNSFNNLNKPNFLKLSNPFENDSLEMWFNASWTTWPYNTVHHVDKGTFILKKNFDCSKIKLNAKNYKYFKSGRPDEVDLNNFSKDCHDRTFKIIKAEEGLLYAVIKSSVFDEGYDPEANNYFPKKTEDYTRLKIKLNEYRKLPNVMAIFNEKELFPDSNNPRENIEYLQLQEEENYSAEHIEWKKKQVKDFTFLGGYLPIKDVDQSSIKK
tara:strand:- start:18954 stop:20123 length:1170 start_codon:yes stop_codon:yes gene_type:complete